MLCNLAAMQARHEDTLAAEQRVEAARQQVAEAEAVAAARLQAVNDAEVAAQRHCAAADEKVAEVQTVCDDAYRARDDAVAAREAAERERDAAQQVCFSFFLLERDLTFHTIDLRWYFRELQQVNGSNNSWAHTIHIRAIGLSLIHI